MTVSAGAGGTRLSVLLRAVVVGGIAMLALGVATGATTQRASSAAVEPAEGSELGWADVAPIVERHCATCHRAGGIAPFALGDYAQARPWARSMRRAVELGTMPPWHADPEIGVFANDRRLPATARATLLAWLDAGAPRGATSGESAVAGDAPDEETPDPRVGGREDPAGVPAPEGETSWLLGTPDAVVALPEVEVPASGELPYHDYRVPSPFEGEVWLRGVEVLPGDATVVHHVIVEAFDPRSAWRRGADPRTVGSLGGYVPGDPPRLLPEGMARRLPAGSEIVLQIHYAPSGAPARDRTRIGFHLSDGPPREVVESGIVSTPFLWIPAGSVGVERSATHRFDRPVRLLSLRPHLHLRGRSFEFSARLPGGEQRPLLRVPRWDFDWQTTYLLAEPVELPAGAELVAVATWDNSPSNPDNPDPARDVSWGEATTDEMMIGFFDYVPLGEAPEGGSPRP